MLLIDSKKWIDHVVCIKKRGTASDDVIGDAIKPSLRCVKISIQLNLQANCDMIRRYFVTKPGTIAKETVLSVDDLASDVNFTFGGPFLSWTASMHPLETIKPAPQRFLNIYWGSTNDDIVFPLHQSCAILANRYL